jgi:hypothetical protein
LTEFFDLERGNAQGDTISPFCFNLGYQILLFKLNFDLQILGGIEVPDSPPEGSTTPAQSATSSIFRTKTKVMAMADDATCITKIDFNSLNRIKTILTDFRLLSGLECNVEKTVLMPLGGGPLPENVRNLGFEIKEKITVLGMEIDAAGNHTENNGIIITEKIKNQISFWQRFSLSFPGRVNIAKSMLYSQLNYLGSIIDFETHWYERWEKLITTYVKGILNIAKDRFFLPKDAGGVGLFKVQDFLDAQKVGWLRLANVPDKTWKQTVWSVTHGNPFSGRAIMVNKRLNPSIYCMLRALDKLRDCITINNDNYKVSDIVLNKNLRKQFGNREMYGIDYFQDEQIHKILRLRVSDFFNFGPHPDTATAKTYDEVRTFLPNLDHNKYMQILYSCRHAHGKYKNNFIPGQKPESIVDVLTKKKQSRKV